LSNRNDVRDRRTDGQTPDGYSYTDRQTDADATCDISNRPHLCTASIILRNKKGIDGVMVMAYSHSWWNY